MSIVTNCTCPPGIIHYGTDASDLTIFHCSTRDAMKDGPNFEKALPTDSAARKAIPLQTGLFDYFPDALCAVAVLSRAGNDQHHPDEPLHWDRTKSMDQGDTILRHQMQHGLIDNDKVRHSTKVAWRALAQLQLELEAARDK